MEFLFSNDSPEKQSSACIVVGIFEKGKLSASAKRLDEACAGKLSLRIAHGDIEGKPGQTLVLYDLPNIASERVLLVGCGEETELSAAHYLEAIAKSVTAASTLGCSEITSYLPELTLNQAAPAWKLCQAVQVTQARLYRFDRLKSKKNSARRQIEKVTLALPGFSDIKQAEHALREGEAISLGVRLVRDLGNLPANICTPTYLAEQAMELQKHYPITTTVLEIADMEVLGMGALLSVARGSRQPAKFITLEYKNSKNDTAPIALVGKGVTFDTGGISIKPAAAMDEMKYDMCGAATVLGVLKSAAELKLPLNLIGIIPTTENMPGGNASKPGDVVTSMSGQTIEILNTDAEGRLILCDALTYAERFKPAVVIDIATLTGACVIALGAHASGLLSNNDALAAELIAAGSDTHDRAWQLPLWEEYQKQLDTNFADMANIGGREAGTITAACFLSRFTKKYAWAHLDIAGTAWKSGKEKGATGRPVPLLMQFLLNRCQ